MKKNISFYDLLFSISFIASTIFISGCLMIGPDYEKPQTSIPDAWHTSVAKDLSSQETPMRLWWTVFNDKELNQIIQDVCSNNYSLATASEVIQETAARFGISRSAILPEIWADGSYNRLRDSERIKFKGDYPDNPYNLYDTGFSMSWELDLWGRVKRGVIAAGANLGASIEDYRDLLVVLQAKAATTYIGIRTTQQRLIYARNNLALQTKTLKLTKNRFEAELTSELDVRQAEMNIASTKALIPQLETFLSINANRLCMLAGKAPGAYDHLLKKSAPLPTDLTIPAVLPADLLRNRPDIRASERRLAAQTQMIGIAEAELFPMFSLNGYFDWQASTSSDWFDPQSRTYGFGPSFSWSIFNYGRVHSNIAMEEAHAKQAMSAYQQTVLEAWQESENSLIAYTKEVERKSILRDAVKAANRSAELVQVQYKNGLTDFQNVLNTQRELFIQQDSLAVSEGTAAANLIAVYKAFGGGWMPEKVEK